MSGSSGRGNQFKIKNAKIVVEFMLCREACFTDSPLRAVCRAGSRFSFPRRSGFVLLVNLVVCFAARASFFRLGDCFANLGVGKPPLEEAKWTNRR